MAQPNANVKETLYADCLNRFQAQVRAIETCETFENFLQINEDTILKLQNRYFAFPGELTPAQEQVFQQAYNDIINILNSKAIQYDYELRFRNIKNFIEYTNKASSAQELTELGKEVQPILAHSDSGKVLTVAQVLEIEKLRVDLELAFYTKKQQLGIPNKSIKDVFGKVLKSREAVKARIESCNTSEEFSNAYSVYQEQSRSGQFAIPSGPKFKEEHVETLRRLNQQIATAMDSRVAQFAAYDKLVKDIKQCTSHEKLLEIQGTINIGVEPEALNKAQALQMSTLKNELDREISKKRAELGFNSVTFPITDVASLSRPLLGAEKELTRQKELSLVTMQLKAIQGIQEKYKTSSPKIAEAAQYVYDKINGLSAQYIEDGKLESFKAESKNILEDENNEHIKELNKSSVFREILGNLLYLILGFVVGYVGYCIYQKGFFKFPTEQAKQVSALKDAVAAAPAA